MSPKNTQPPRDGDQPPPDQTTEPPATPLRVVPTASSADAPAGKPKQKVPASWAHNNTGPRRRGADVQITHEKYDRAVEAYLHGTRSANGLARRLKISRVCAKRMIERGYPARGWAALKDRAEIYDKEVERERDKRSKISPQQVDEMGRWTAMREENMQITRGLRALAATLADKVIGCVRESTARRVIVRRKVVTIQVGKGRTRDTVVTEEKELPPYLPELARAARAITTMVATAGSSEAFWAKITVPDHLKGASTGWDKLTEEELSYIIANGGKLPVGVTVEQLRQRQ